MKTAGQVAAERRTAAQVANAAMSETVLQNTVINLARTFGWRVAHFRPVKQLRRDGSVRHLTAVQADGVGFPDLVMTRADRAIVAELKSEAGRLSPEQVLWLASFKAAKVETYVWRPRDLDEIERTLR